MRHSQYEAQLHSKFGLTSQLESNFILILSKQDRHQLPVLCSGFYFGLCIL